jgi:putative endopeptidase
MNALIDSTDLDTIKTYLRWQLINGIAATALPTALDDEDFNFNGRELSGQPEQEARWKRCVAATDGALGRGVGRSIREGVLPRGEQAGTVQMVHDIEDCDGQRIIGTLTWMSDETKAKAREKLHMVADKIGYPDHFRDYSKLKVVRGDAIGNAIRAVEFENRRQLAKIGKPVDRGEWGMSPPTINAYYNPSMNDINFPAGILQSPFFDPSAPDAELRTHRRCCRTRADARLRRPGTAIRRQRQSRRLVDGRRWQEVRRDDGLRSEGVRRLHGD